MHSPTQRSLKFLRDQGWTAEVVERWIPGANIRKDLFGFCDIFCFSPERRQFLMVQTTTWSHLSEHVRKILSLPVVVGWLSAGGFVQAHGWKKVGPRGKRKKWEVEVQEITLDSVRTSIHPKKGVRR